MGMFRKKPITIEEAISDGLRPGTPAERGGNVAGDLRVAGAGILGAGRDADDLVTAPANDEERRAALRSEIINTPETADFMAAVPLEAAHQRERWGADHDAGKQPEDWFWLLGYLGGKALAAAKAGDLDKAKHHTISSAAALANWHAALIGINTRMRPGVDPAALEADRRD